MSVNLFYKISFIILTLFCFSCTRQDNYTTIIIPNDAGKLEALAAQEVRRYVYLRTGKLLSIVRSDTIKSGTDIIIIAKKGRSLIRNLNNAAINENTAKFSHSEFLLKTISYQNDRITVICGGDEIGSLYAAYQLAENLGVRFYPHGDVIPDKTIRLQLDFDKIHKPFFDIRGIQPFHDFPEGPDWWNLDNYKAILSQLAKMKMNFIGLHTYPEGSVGPEPTIWIGTKNDLLDDGDVKFSYPARHFTTCNGTWGYQAKKTSDYYYGMGNLFESDAYGADYMEGMAPWPQDLAACNNLFNLTGNFFSEVFNYAKIFGIKTCVGTETPLIVPRELKNRLKESAGRKQLQKTKQDLYEGIFQWIMKNYSLDYYWFWTPENWTWGGNTEEDIKNTKDDVAAAIKAAEEVQAPFTLATCGWVLGPKIDRTLFDNFLPKNMPMSSINRRVGFAPLDINYARLKDRPKWAIPWLEDDPAMIIPQLWAGRMRRDAADALAYGCTGLIGIHWRTRILGPNVSALANAAWQQELWNPGFGKPFNPPDIELLEGSPGALFTTFADTTIGDRQADPTLALHGLDRPRDLSVEDFYLDWAQTQFGEKLASPMAALFTKLDGSSKVEDFGDRLANLPRPANWRNGPGGLFADPRSWELVRKEYEFIDEMEAFRDKIEGKGNLERFDYWLNNFKYLRAMGEFNCTLNAYNLAMEDVRNEKNSQEKNRKARENVLPIRIRQIAQLQEIHKYLAATIKTTGALGVVANWQQHNIPMHIEKPGQELEQILGENLPESALPSKEYPDEAHLIIPAVRTCLLTGESLQLKVILLGGKANEAYLYWKAFGDRSHQQLALNHVNRGVYHVTIASESIHHDFEYYVQVKTDKNETLLFPATAPETNQTVVVLK